MVCSRRCSSVTTQAIKCTNKDRNTLDRSRKRLLNNKLMSLEMMIDYTPWFNSCSIMRNLPTRGESETRKINKNSLNSGTSSKRSSFWRSRQRHVLKIWFKNSKNIKMKTTKILLMCCRSTRTRKLVKGSTQSKILFSLLKLPRRENRNLYQRTN